MAAHASPTHPEILSSHHVPKVFQTILTQLYHIEFRQAALRVCEYLRSMRKTAKALGVSAATFQ